jgi:hypothetical protein
MADQTTFFRTSWPGSTESQDRDLAWRQGYEAAREQAATLIETFTRDPQIITDHGMRVMVADIPLPPDQAAAIRAMEPKLT